MTEDTPLPFDLPAASRKKVTADFAGGSISSDGGLVLLRGAERRLGLAERLAGCIRDWRDPALVVHTLPAMLRFRMFAIACGYEDADDCDALRGDPLFKLAVGRAPESGRDLCSQPTMSRLENAPSRIEVARMTAALVDIFCRSFPAPPTAITLDIDDTCDAVHGQQQLSLFNAFYDTRCFLPVHVYHVESGKPVAVLLRPGKTPSGVEVRILLKHLVRRIRRHWPRTRLTFRGDSHYGRTEAMAWCEDNGVDYIFGLAGNPVLHRFAYGVADDLKVRRAEAGAEKMRSFAAFDYAAGSWNRERRVVARLEATARGFDARYIVTSLGGEPRHLYEDIYCARGQAENLIKLHKVQLASDRTSCQSPLANQFRLVLHTAAYWLMLALRDAVPRRMTLAWAEFATLRQRLLKIGGPRRREGRPDPHPLRLGLSRRRPVPPAGRAPRRLGPLIAGAPCPANPSPFNPKPGHYQPQIPAPQGAERQPARA